MGWLQIDIYPDNDQPIIDAISLVRSDIATVLERIQKMANATGDNFTQLQAGIADMNTALSDATTRIEARVNDLVTALNNNIPQDRLAPLVQGIQTEVSGLRALADSVAPAPTPTPPAPPAPTGGTTTAVPTPTGATVTDNGPVNPQDTGNQAPPAVDAATPAPQASPAPAPEVMGGSPAQSTPGA